MRAPDPRQEGIGGLAIKPLAGGHIMESETFPATESLHFAMNLSVATVINGKESMKSPGAGIAVSENLQADNGN